MRSETQARDFPAFAAQVIRPALGVAEYGLSPGQAHLVLIEAGASDGPAPLLSAPQILWLPQGEGRRLRLMAGSRGMHLALSTRGLLQAMPTGPLFAQLRGLLSHRLVLSPGSEQRRIAAQMRDIADELYRAEPGAEVLVTSVVTALLILLWRQAQGDRVYPRSVPRSVVDGFVLLVAEHRRDHWRVEDYARALGVSRDRLGGAIQRATGLSPQAYIHREMLAEARDLLQNAPLHVAEIAFRLGFQDPAYFSRFFTRAEGLSPGRYRRMRRAAAGGQDQSFAAWP
ncbi:helix-turn-helix domain-containing protein [Plastorhodobacter daqingensis]|uniref:Helix-turn-helix domain-containing protein n=1 Tax=Plastorhodobacter daqingensis TaxID=1387281 RepID=A0ABW2UI85_9RHOB